MAELHGTDISPNKSNITTTKRNALKQRHRNLGFFQESQQIYIVERILNYKTVRGKKMVWIKWKGFPDSESTWEPEEAIFDLPRTSQLSFPTESLVFCQDIDDESYLKTTELHDTKVFSDYKSLKRVCDSREEFSQYNKVRRRHTDNTDHSSSVESFLCSSAKQISTTELAPVEATLMELAVKLELIDISPPTIKPIDEWSIEEVRDHLIAAGYILEAVKLAEEEIDGMALTCINSPFILEQCGIPAESAHGLYPFIQRMQANRFHGS